MSRDAGVATTPAHSIAHVRRDTARVFRDAGMDTPDLDARILIGYALGLDHSHLASQGDRGLSASEVAHIDALVARRLTHEPVARIVGRKEFWGLPLAL